MSALWFLPLAFAVGIAGTRTWLLERHALRAARDKAPWLLPVLAWLPLVCWILSRFVRQE